MSTTSVLVFGEIETSTNRALAYAILMAQAAHAYLALILDLREGVKSLEGLVSVLTPDRLERLSAEQKEWLKPRLQETHKHLVAFARSEHAARLGRLPVLDGLVARMQDSTEDVNDIIEDIVLAEDADFRNLISACAKNIKAPEEERFARMQD
jgi:hypothetical protein